MKGIKMGITSKHYNGLQKAYAEFNRKLFEGELPECIITLQRKAHSYGYFHYQHMENRLTGEHADEIALNPDNFRDDKDVLSTLVHEMAHLWQFHFGTPSRAGYHNSEWVEKMITIGLQPVSLTTGTKGTGQSVDHTIIENGAFDKAFKRLLSQRGWKLDWQSSKHQAQPAKLESGLGEDEGNPEADGEAAPKKKTPSKVKYTCPHCKLNAWAKPSALLVCGMCYADTGVIVTLLSED